MSVDTVFQPKAPTVNVKNSAIQVLSPGTPLYNSTVSFRIVNLAATAATQRVGWGPTASSTSAAAPGGSGIANGVYSITLEGNGVITLELPGSTFFIGSDATNGLEITPGQGNTGT